MPAAPLLLSEREEIRAGIERGESVTAVALRLGRHRCTISAEVARNGGRDAYRATSAQQRAEAQRSRPKTPILVARPDLAAHVETRLRAKDSPMTIAIELARGIYPSVEGQVSHETIYAAVYAHGRRGLAKGLHLGLHRCRRCRKRAPPQKRAAASEIASRCVQADRIAVSDCEGAQRGRPSRRRPDHRRRRPLRDRHRIRPGQPAHVAGRPTRRQRGHNHPRRPSRTDRADPHPTATQPNPNLGPRQRNGPLGRPRTAMRNQGVLR